MEYKITNENSTENDTIDLNEIVFNTKVSDASIYESVKNLLANKRQGTSSTKTRAMVNGSTKKPWRQKGTGRARVGSRKSPLWKGQGIIFGPHPRDYSYKIPKKVRRRALFSVLTKARQDGSLKIVDDFVLEEIKTKIILSIFSKFFPKESNKEQIKRVLFIITAANRENYEKIKKSGANVPWLKIINVNSIEIKDLFYAQWVVFSKSAIQVINERYEDYGIKNGI